MDDKLCTRLFFTVRVCELAADLEGGQLKVWRRYIAVDEGAAAQSNDVMLGSWNGDLSEVKFPDENFELDFSDKYLFEIEKSGLKAQATIFSKEIARVETVSTVLKAGDEVKGRIDVTTVSGLSSELVYLKLKGINLEDMDTFSKSDPFFTISAQDFQRQYRVLYCSETIEDNLDPNWKGFFLYKEDLVRDGVEFPILLKVYDKDPTGNDYIGGCQVRLSELLSATRPLELYKTDDGSKSGSIRGRMAVQRSHCGQNKNLVDYMRSGLEFSLSVIIDFSDKNTPTRGVPLLHDLTEGGNNYLSTLKYLSWFFHNFDSNGRYAMYGFGAKLDGSDYVNHCFPIGEQGAESVQGPEGVKAAYQEKLQSLSMASPCYFHPVMRHLLAPFESPRVVCEVGGPLQYNIFVFLTQGESDDFEEFKEQIVRASSLPISVILVGVGKKEFSQLFTADADRTLMKTQRGHVEERDIVQRVIYANYTSDRDFVHEAFAEIPKQVREFIMANKLV